MTRATSSPVAQNRPAAAKPIRLQNPAARVAEIDQIEVHAVDIGIAQVGAAEIGFADFFGVLESGIEVFVGVVSGSAPFAGNGASDQAAAGRAHVEGRAVQVGMPQDGAFPIDLGQPAAAQAGATKACRRKYRSGQQCAIKKARLKSISSATSPSRLAWKSLASRSVVVPKVHSLERLPREQRGGELVR